MKWTKRPAESSIGEVYGQLTVVGIKYRTRSDGRKKAWAHCTCACGGTHSTWLNTIRQGAAKGCQSCYGSRIAAIHRTHGHTPSGGKPSSEYSIFAAMWGRCTNPNNPAWKNYGGRGITVDPRWEEFSAFLADMGKRPSKLHTLEREKNDMGYGPDNCVWATRRVQSRNHRRNRIITVHGRTMILEDWAEFLGVPSNGMYAKFKKYGTPELAIKEVARSRGIVITASGGAVELSLPPE